MQHQVENLTRYVSVDDIAVVVGHKKELIMEAFRDLAFVYNNDYDTTNTSKSLMRGLAKLQGHDVLWMNGDVVFDHTIIPRLTESGRSCMAVNAGAVGDDRGSHRESRIGHVVRRGSDSVRKAGRRGPQGTAALGAVPAD